jgi:hypothetical protein
MLRLSHPLWVQQQSDRYGAAAETGWRVGYGLWRLVRAVLNPLQAAGQETSAMFVEKTASALSYRLRAYATRMFVLEVGRAAIDLYSGRLELSDEEVRAAQARDAAEVAAPVPPVRIVLIGQVSAGKSSLLNALAQDIRGAVGPVPTTTGRPSAGRRLEGRPALILVDLPGLGASADGGGLAGAGRARRSHPWVASATQPARQPDRQGLDNFSSWAKAQLVRRVPPVVLALTRRRAASRGRVTPP